ncbi:uncharacterized protein [Drosophila bipectinata]|uniref:uncharacterized protein n=1 Tax=Drosophila bipectinata TaxID=42026 RepID=UPI001C895966|nr:uncharacterized protein LOC108124898 [Drosophila bipectinata]
MQTLKIPNRLLVSAPKNSKGCVEVGELRSLILELMKPRTAQMNKILLTRMVPATRDEYDEVVIDWWPDYELFSNSHAITDMNGILVYTKKALQGMPDDLKAIAEKFDYAYFASKLKNQNKGKKYYLVADLIQDMTDYVTNFGRLCTHIIEERRRIHDQASETLDTADRIKVKIFDEKSFVRLQTRLTSLRNFVQEFCALFEIPLKAPEESNVEPFNKFANLQKPIQKTAKATDKAKAQS